VPPREQLRERAEVGDGAQHAVPHDVGRDERERVAEPRPRLVVRDRALDLGADLLEVAVGAQTAALDARHRVEPDDVVGVDRHAALRIRRLRAPLRPWSRAGAVMADAIPSTAATNGPRRTSAPSHDASSTRASDGTNDT